MSRTRATLAEFVRAPQDRVLLHPQHARFAYSDGKEVEERIHRLLQGTADLSVGSGELLAKIEDWPTEYHFSDTRANLLRHLPLAPGVRVLELGAGCGALTRWLGERGCEVVAVEGSLARARCAGERVRDLANVSVCCADFQDVAFSRQHDIVTLIGVLEYAPMFFSGPDPIGACLEVARSALAPGGTLVVAIENQLGLKYFAGATEDHLGIHFAGVENRYAPDGVRTLGRRQVERALQRAGFAAVEFQYPFPDYKLPVAIVFEAALERADFRPSEIVRHLYARDYAGKDLHAIDAAQVWPVLEDNGLLGDLSNSFLVLAQESATARTAPDAEGELLALAFSAGRARPFQTRTAFRATGPGDIACEKTLLYPAEAAQPQPARWLSHRLLREPYVPGTTLHSAVAAALRAGAAERVLELLRRWLAFLGERADAGAARTWDARLPGEFWDCTPDNLIDTGAGLHYFDAEWVAQPGPTIGNLLFRYVFSLGYRDATSASFQACFEDRYAGFAVRSVLRRLGMELTEQDIAEFARQANETNAIVFPLKPHVALDAGNFFREVWETQPDPGAAKPAAHEILLQGLRRISRVLTK